MEIVIQLISANIIERLLQSGAFYYVQLIALDGEYGSSHIG